MYNSYKTNFQKRTAMRKTLPRIRSYFTRFVEKVPSSEERHGFLKSSFFPNPKGISKIMTWRNRKH